MGGLASVAEDLGPPEDLGVDVIAGLEHERVDDPVEESPRTRSKSVRSPNSAITSAKSKVGSEADRSVSRHTSTLGTLESSFSALSAARNASPNFTTTSLESLRKSTMMLLKHWCLERDQRACCPWHNALSFLDRVIDELASRECDPL